MINIAICDDDIYFAGELDTILKCLEKQKHVTFEIDVLSNGVELIERYQDNNIQLRKRNELKQCFEPTYIALKKGDYL